MKSVGKDEGKGGNGGKGGKPQGAKGEPRRAAAVSIPRVYVYKAGSLARDPASIPASIPATIPATIPAAGDARRSWAQLVGPAARGPSSLAQLLGPARGPSSWAEPARWPSLWAKLVGPAGENIMIGQIYNIQVGLLSTGMSSVRNQSSDAAPRDLWLCLRAMGPTDP